MQVLKFMDTRIRKIFQRIFLICFIIHVSTNLQSQDFEKEYLTLKNLKMKKNTWLDKYQIYFNSSVIKKKDLSGDVEGLLEIGSYFYEIERKQINSITNTKTAKSLYVIEEKQNKRIKFTDGSLIIKFNGTVNYKNFADQNSLIFVSDLSSIQRGVFKVKNIFNLKKIARELIAMDHVHSVELNIVNPNISLK